jgi:CubicO group peptidase (beta-lactamase class C family)
VTGSGTAVARIRDYEVAQVDMHGVAEDAVLQVGSISKPVAALVALRLVEDGLLGLDADVNESLTSWQVPGGKVTPRQLLSHTGGVSVEWFPGHPNGGAYPTLLQVLEGEPPSNTDPIRVDASAQGSYRYSGGGYAVVQQLVEDVTGTAFAEAAEELVLYPLGMHDSTYEQELPAGLRGRAAHGYRGEEEIEGGWHVYPASTPRACGRLHATSAASPRPSSGRSRGSRARSPARPRCGF